MPLVWKPWLGFLLFSAVAAAQFTSGLEGTVHDPAQAVVPGAEIIVVNEDTQVTLRTRTNENGLFRLPQLPPGTYRVEVRQPGFRSWVQGGLVLEGNELRTLYPVLAVGEQQQIGEVTAAEVAV